METKKCLDCKEEKPLSDFYNHVEKKRKGALRYSSYCKKCEIIRSKKITQNPIKRELYNKNRKNRRLNDPVFNEKILASQRERYRKNQISRLFYNVKERSKKFGYECNITKEDIIIPEFCPILNIKLQQGTQGNYLFTPSIDRIDNSKGYIKGNIAVISMLANTMKSSASIEQLLAFSKNIENYLYKNKDIVRPIEKIESIELEDKELLR